MQKVAIFLMFLATALTGCQTKVATKGPWVQKIDSWAFSSLVINFSAKMKIENHLDLEDSYITYDQEVKKIVLRYSSQRLLTLYESRLLIVELVEEFIDWLNNNQELSSELEHFPFTSDDLDVRINFESFYGKYCDEQYMGIIWLNCGCVYFYAFDRKDLDLDFDHDRIEPYRKSRELALIKKEVDQQYLEQAQAAMPKPALESIEGYKDFTP